MTEIWRQKEKWQKEATVQFATGQSKEALEQYAAHNSVHEFHTQSEAKTSLIDSWNDDRISQPDKTQIIMAYTRKDVHELNQIARSIRELIGEIGEGHTFQTEKGERQFAEGDRIYFLKNDRDLGVKNGTLGTILDIENNTLSVEIDKVNGESSIIQFSTDRYNHLDYGYAATIHKGQGVSVDRSYILASKHLDRHASYVAMTRHKESAEMFWSKEEFPQYDDLINSFSNERSKDSTLDYSINDFVNNHSIELMSGLNTFDTYPSEQEVSESNNIKDQEISL